MLGWGQLSRPEQSWRQADFLPRDPVRPTTSWDLWPPPQTALGPQWAGVCPRQLWANVGQGLRPIRVLDLRVGVFVSVRGSRRADPALERESQI